MFILIRISYFVYFLSFALAKPQYGSNSDANCHTFETDGYKCVKQDECTVGHCLDSSQANTAACKNQAEHVQILSSDCFIVKNVFEIDVCCHDSLINKTVSSNNNKENKIEGSEKPPNFEPQVNCRSLESEGYSCVLQDECKASICPSSSSDIDIRNAFPDEIDCDKEKEHVEQLGLECIGVKNSFQVYACCHESLIKKPEETVHKNSTKLEPIGNCKSFEPEGYRCVSQDQCRASICATLTNDNQSSDIDIRNGEESIDCDTVKEHVEYLYSDCIEVKDGLQSSVCCHESLIKKTVPEEISGNCRSFESDGYRCVSQDECKASVCLPNLDIQNAKENFDCIGEKNKVDHLNFECLGVKNSFQTSVCCHKSLIINQTTPSAVPEEISGNCRSFESDGYRCVSQDECKASVCLSDLDIRNAEENFDCIGEKNKVDHLNFECLGVKNSFQTSVCCHESLIINQTSASVDPTRCGVHNTKEIDIRAGGLNPGTSFGEWPHICALFKGDEVIGGASIITPGLVLTAAHKVQDVKKSMLKIRCGDWNLKIQDTSEETSHYQERTVQQVMTHPSFDKNTVINDIALLQMNEEFVLADHIIPICLPKDSNILTQISKSDCITAGWGKDVLDPKNNASDVLKQAVVPLFEQSDCKRSLTSKYHDSFICAGGQKGEDACEGDGGAPLFCRLTDTQEEHYVQLGIVAWGTGCGRENTPGVYASIIHGLCFINWATKCIAEKRYFSYYNLEHCRNWIDEERNRQIEKKATFEKRLSEDNLDSIGKTIAEINLKKAVKALENIDDLSGICDRK